MQLCTPQHSPSCCKASTNWTGTYRPPPDQNRIRQSGHTASRGQQSASTLDWVTQATTRSGPHSKTRAHRTKTAAKQQYLDHFEGKLPEAQHHGAQGVVDGLGEGLGYLSQQGSGVGALAPLKAHQQLGAPHQPHPQRHLRGSLARSLMQSFHCYSFHSFTHCFQKSDTYRPDLRMRSCSDS